MPVSEQQFEYLTEMGITLWQRRQVATQEMFNTLPIDNQQLLQSQVFIDILNSMGLSIADVEITSDAIKLPKFHWRFEESEQAKFENNTLFSASIDKLTPSAELKKQLWSCIKNHA